jgi:hypothetical protein
MEELKNITPSCQLFRHRLRLRICRSARQRRRGRRRNFGAILSLHPTRFGKGAREKIAAWVD